MTIPARRPFPSPWNGTTSYSKKMSEPPPAFHHTSTSIEPLIAVSSRRSAESVTLDVPPPDDKIFDFSQELSGTFVLYAIRSSSY